MADMMRQKKAQNSATISIIIALFTIVPAICYLLSAIIAKRYYSLTTHNLKTVMEQLAQWQTPLPATIHLSRSAELRNGNEN